MNHQMFAFNYGTNQKMCGISTDKTNYDMKITADFEPKTISTNELKWNEGQIYMEDSTRQYDSCYYEINAEISEEKMKELED